MNYHDFDDTPAERERRMKRGEWVYFCFLAVFLAICSAARLMVN